MPPVSCETGGDKTDANPFHIQLNITADSTIVCLGDSLTYGDGADSPPAESYPWWLQDMVDLEVVNSGESGNTSGDALARVQEDVLDHNPVIVIVELGANDYLNDLDPETTLDNLEAIINSCRASGAVVFLCRFFSDEMADEYSQSDPDGVETLITMYASLAERGVFSWRLRGRYQNPGSWTMPAPAARRLPGHGADDFRGHEEMSNTTILHCRECPCRINLYHGRTVIDAVSYALLGIEFGTGRPVPSAGNILFIFIVRSRGTLPRRRRNFWPRAGVLGFLFHAFSLAEVRRLSGGCL